MADDRYEAYKELFTRSQIREILQQLNPYDQADFVYACIQTALDSEHQSTTSIISIVQQTTKHGQYQPTDI
jgi:hypothetical protein